MATTTQQDSGAISISSQEMGQVERRNSDDDTSLPNNCSVIGVAVRNAFKSFGKIGVLENFSMTVEKGTLYSLLGNSGCGKTTTLSCIVGVKKLDKGGVSVFGVSRPEQRAFGIPGRRVGYMPQDTSLYSEFSIAETLSYFGTVCGMDSVTLEERIEFVVKLLNLPDSERIVGTLSGGQRRRVSFAVAIIHKPELILLDEPTAGVDPLLREIIWKHLRHLTAVQGTTIILTTHYLDEARFSDKIGVIRNGSLIAEDKVSDLFSRFETTSVETLVLKLYTLKSTDLLPVRADPLEALTYKKNVQCKKVNTVQSTKRRVKALVRKNSTLMFRNLRLLIFSTIVPSIVIYLTCIGFHNEPQRLPLGVVNRDANMSTCLKEVNKTKECSLDNLSCQFMNRVPPEILRFKPYNTIEEAVQDVKLGKIWGYILFPANYSSHVFNRGYTKPRDMDNDTIDNSKIYARLDQTSKVIYIEIWKTLYQTLQKHAEEMMKNCGMDEKRVQHPLQFKPPILGSSKLTVLAFVTPSLALGLGEFLIFFQKIYIYLPSIRWLLFFPLVSTSVRYIQEKKQGTIERCRAAGIQVYEILIAFTITEFTVLCVQSLLVYVILRVVFNLGEEANPYSVLSLTILNGFNGMCFGFLLAMLCKDEVEAAVLTIAIFLPNTFVSGGFWPKEGMPQLLQNISVFLPFTLPCEALRSLLNRGSEFTNPNVWPGFVSLVAYTVLYLSLAIIIYKMKSQ